MGQFKENLNVFTKKYNAPSLLKIYGTAVFLCRAFHPSGTLYWFGDYGFTNLESELYICNKMFLKILVVIATTFLRKQDNNTK